jgi:rfaE bifunctional protein kinase chain/domain
MITASEFEQVRRKAATISAMVIGDVMLDRYIHGTVDRISPEAPVPILHHQRTEVKLGGAANVALNLNAWGCQVSLFGLVGNDERAIVLSQHLDQAGIAHFNLEDEHRPTTAKTRVVASSHHLLRIDEESSSYIAGEKEREAIVMLKEYLERWSPDLIVVEDYNKGLLTAAVIKTILDYGRSHAVFMAVDPKEQHFFDYRDIDLFKPNLREAGHASRLALDQEAELKNLGSDWMTKYGWKNLAVTLGGRGIFLQDKSGAVIVPPSRAIDVIDVCGAGDAVVCALALGIMAGLPGEKCADLANLAGAYVCSHSGVVAVNVEEIYQWI